jgi:peptidoglycan hydrolase CwlO-like protein
MNKLEGIEMETEKVQKKEFNFLKSKKVLFITGIIILLFISFGIGSSAAKVTLDEEKVSYDELVGKINERKKELSNLHEHHKKQVAQLEEKLTDKKTQVDEALELVEKRDDIASEISTLTSTITSKKAEITNLDSVIAGKKEELATIEGGIKEKKEAPKVLSAGQFLVGKDIPAGRYKAVANGGSGNFVVYSSSGALSVNTILGGRIGESEYVFYAQDGDLMELSTSVKFIGVE